MTDNSTNNKRIAKNTLMLYIRMIILLIVNLYSSRIVLQELGAEDYGIYNVVGGIVAMFTFLNTTMSGATSRFLTYELGKNDLIRLTETFKAALTLHLLIASLILFAAETIGLWFVNEVLVIPNNKMDAANIVYQFSILTIIVKTVQVPFNASIISHERMNVYAWIEIINASIIVGFLYMLQLWDTGKLIIYASMLFTVALCVLCMYVFYCKQKFSDCILKTSSNWKIMKPMLLFSGFDLYGNMCVTARTQGINIILNLFFGTLINAANGIATQVQAAILMVSNNITLAFRPQIIKNYAKNELKEMEKQVNSSSMISVLLFSICAIPLVLEMPYVLALWLKTPPAYTENITRIAIITCWIGTINSVLSIPIHATGQIKGISIYGGTIYLLTLPAAYIVLKIWAIPELAYFTMLAFMFTLLTITCRLLKNKIPQFSLSHYWFKNLFPCFFCIILSGLCIYFIRNTMEEGFLRLASMCIIYIIVLFVTVFFIALNKRQRSMLKTYISKKINIHKTCI